MPKASQSILASCLFFLACDASAPSRLLFTGEWVGQYAGSNVDLVITQAASQTVVGTIAFSDNLSSGGCGSTEAARPLQQGQYYPDSVVFGIPVAAGTTPSTIRGRVRYAGLGLELKIEADPEISMARC